MKTILKLFSFFPLLLFAQNSNPTIYTYKLYKITKPVNEVESTNREIKDFIGINRLDTIEYEFSINLNYAVSKPLPKLNNDQGNFGIDLTSIIIDSYGTFDYDLTDSTFYNTKEYNGKKYSIKYNYNYINWKYDSTLETIKDLQCKKASYSKIENLKGGKTRKYVVTVWYSEEINPHVAPFGLSGLPGGIVKINFNNFSEVLLDTIRQPQKAVKIKPTKFGKIITEEEFDELLQK